MNKKSLGEIISEDIKKKILNGEYRSGEKLPTERQLAEQYKVSRVPIRDALAILAQENIIVSKRGSGTFVTPGKSPMDSQRNDTPYLDYQIFFQESIQLRCLVEAEACRQAALHATESDIIQIQKTLFRSIDEIRRLKAGQENHFFQADAEFHLSVADASHMPFFHQCLSSIHQTISSHQYWSLKNTSPIDEVVSYHTSIFEAILSKNADRAYASMYKHLSRVKSLLPVEGAKAAPTPEEQPSPASQESPASEETPNKLPEDGGTESR